VLKSYTLVTGASEGLGRDFAALAAEEGRNVILSARRKDKLDALAAELAQRHGIDAHAIPADLSRETEAERLWAEAAQGRRIDILVNNAGLGRNGLFAEGGWEREQASIAVNITAATILMKKAADHMLAQGGGRILNVASVAAFMPGPHMAVYHATKAYLLSLSDAAAEELRGKPVSITALCPGATATGFFKAADLEGGMMLTRMKLPTSRSVAEAGWRGMARGRRIVVPGFSNKGFAFLPRLLPRAAITRIGAAFLARSH
jgi:hypothetical protein